MRRIPAVCAFLVMAMASAFAGEAAGDWDRTDGKGSVRFALCGEAYCGVITKINEPSATAKIGQQVFFAMKRTGENTWAGSAFNPEDGKTYSGKMTMSGNSLTTAGCVFGGLICKSVSWRRAQ